MYELLPSNSTNGVASSFLKAVSSVRMHFLKVTKRLNTNYRSVIIPTSFRKEGSLILSLPMKGKR